MPYFSEEIITDLTTIRAAITVSITYDIKLSGLVAF